METTEQIEKQIRAILREHARLVVDVDDVDSADDLFGAGMSSHTSVNVMLAVEDAFEVEFPDTMLTRDNFASIDAIARSVARLRDVPPGS